MLLHGITKFINEILEREDRQIVKVIPASFPLTKICTASRIVPRTRFASVPDTSEVTPSLVIVILYVAQETPLDMAHATIKRSMYISRQ